MSPTRSRAAWRCCSLTSRPDLGRARPCLTPHPCARATRRAFQPATAVSGMTAVHALATGTAANPTPRRVDRAHGGLHRPCGLHHLHRGRGRRRRKPAAHRSPPGVGDDRAQPRRSGAQAPRRWAHADLPRTGGGRARLPRAARSGATSTAGRDPRRHGTGDRRRRRRTRREPGRARHRVGRTGRAGRHGARANSGGRPTRRRLRWPVRAQLQRHRRCGPGVSRVAPCLSIGRASDGPGRPPLTEGEHR